MKSLDIAATGMLAQQLNVDVISNNISNMNTTGYKRQRAEFQDLLYQSQLAVGSTSSDAGTISPAGVQTGLGVKAAAVYRMTNQGTLTQTDNPFDIAIQGKGYFEIDLPTGETGYTRAGSFQVSPDGELVTTEGYLVQPGVTIPNDATNVTINESGEVIVSQQGVAAPINVGQLSLVVFPNEAGLEAEGSNLLTETAASGGPIAGVPGEAGFGSLIQGFLESSNVDAVAEITSLIRAQRAYEMNSKVIETADQMMSTTTQLR
ncbi:MAG: flagellar basal-body rod protein FlgG [Alphaproteobacteria bacterium]